jgi:glycosyltransferase involved in cell wall biosynthesis
MTHLGCLSPYLPYEGIDHAGGEYLLRYLDEVHKAGWEITLICPENLENIEAGPKAPDWLTVILGPDERHVGKLLRLWRLFRTGLISTPSWKWWDRIDDGVLAALSSSTVIDLQWGQSILLAPSMRLRYPDKPIVGTAHDIMTQSVERARSSSRFKARARARLAHRAVKHGEFAAMNACDLLYVFKLEDRESLLDQGVSADVRTTPPFTTQTSAAPAPDPKSQLIVFTGAFWRSENSESAQWFMQRVWPDVARRCPAARVRFAGSRPPGWLMSIASERVEVTGYLPVLTEAYRGAAMVIAPLVRGAGIKFKVVQAIALGYPIVGTSVAAEGIGSLVGREAVDIHDDPIDFAKAVVATLQDLDARIGQSQDIMNIARDRLDFSHLIQEQIQDYNKLITGRP